MKILKRSQVAIISVSLMLVCAGFLEYKYGPNEDTLGANIFISEKDAYLYQDTTKKANAGTNNVTADDQKEAENKNTNQAETTNYALDKYRLEREKSDSELIDNYKQIIATVTATDKQKQEAQEKIDKILNDKKVIGVVEAILRTEEIQDIVIMPTVSNVNIFVSTKDELTKEQVKNIQTVVQKELSVKTSQISVMRK